MGWRDVLFIMVATVVLMAFGAYQVARARRQAKESLSFRARRSRRRVSSAGQVADQIAQLDELRRRGRIDEATYAAVLRRLMVDDRRGGPR